MAFIKKVWKDRISQFPNRRRLQKQDGSTETVTVFREEGTINEIGDAFSASNLNDLETRIQDNLAPTQETLSKYGLGADGTVDVVLDKLSSTRDLLWENPSVGSFSEQTIKLDYKKYIKVGIEFRTTVQAELNNPNVTYQEINTDSKNVVIFTSAFISAPSTANRAVAVYRYLTLLDDGIEIGNGVRTIIASGSISTSDDNFTAVPTRIYGIK